MIVGTFEPMSVGQVYHASKTVRPGVRYAGVIDADGITHPQPVLVLREATREEWLAEWCDVATSAELTATHHPDARFYEILTD